MKKLTTGILVVVTAAVSFFSGTYFMYTRMCDLEWIAVNAYEDTIKKQNAVSGYTVADKYRVVNYDHYVWKYSITLFEPKKAESLQAEYGARAGENYYDLIKRYEERQARDVEWSAKLDKERKEYKDLFIKETYKRKMDKVQAEIKYLKQEMAYLEEKNALAEKWLTAVNDSRKAMKDRNTALEKYSAVLDSTLQFTKFLESEGICAQNKDICLRALHLANVN